MRVLIVDDDVTFGEMIGAMLAERGYDVVGKAGSVAEARIVLPQLEPDALLLDVHLPDGNGITFAGELLSTDGDLRILLTSTDATAAPARLVERSGATGFVAKTELMATDLKPYLG
jgi:response regulator of citrate/malate metabolism